MTTAQTQAKEFSDDIVVYLPTSDIIVREDLPRVRQDMREINKLAESMQELGQIQPILITRNNELIAGGRRLAACIISGRKVKAVYSDSVDPLTMREMELEENVQRENLTPAEEVLAIEEIHKLKQLKYGTPQQGVKDSGWTYTDTAETIGKTKGNVIEAIQLAGMIHAFPELKVAKTKSDIRRAAKGIEKVAARAEALSDYVKIVESNSGTIPVTIECCDAREHMKTMPDKSVDLLMTDPIYGIDIDEIAIELGGKTGGSLSTHGAKYDDNPEEAIELYEILARESYRFCTDTAHAWVFCAPEFFWLVRKLFADAGWKPYIKPIIWIKGPTGQNNAPHAWPSSAYEMCMYARKADSRLVVEGKVDWINVPRIPPSEKRHGAEKPQALARDLMTRTSLPGQTMFDPFCGSGAFIEQALEMKMIAIGCDISRESYAMTLERIVEWKKRKESK